MFSFFKKKPYSHTPFSALVLELAQGKTVLDLCTTMLMEMERKWDLELIAPPLTVHSSPDGIKAVYPEQFGHIVGLPDENDLWHQFVDKAFFGFLTDTQMILTTQVFCGYYSVIFSNRYSLEATARAWAQIYAKWANQISWQNHQSWDYHDFFGDSSIHIEGGEAWEQAAMKVIEYKTLQNNR